MENEQKISTIDECRDGLEDDYFSTYTIRSLTILSYNTTTANLTRSLKKKKKPYLYFNDEQFGTTFPRIDITPKS